LNLASNNMPPGYIDRIALIILNAQLVG